MIHALVSRRRLELDLGAENMRLKVELIEASARITELESQLRSLQAFTLTNVGHGRA